MTSGSLFTKDGRGWTGKIDDCEPNATSSNCTNSAIFRLNTKNFGYGNVKVADVDRIDAGGGLGWGAHLHALQVGVQPLLGLS